MLERSRLYFVQLDKVIDNNKFLEMVDKLYNGYEGEDGAYRKGYKDSSIFIKSNLKDNEYYECWSLEYSYLKIDDYRYLLKLPSGFSPNDTAGNFNLLDNESKPLVLDLNIDSNSYPPFGFRFSDIEYCDKCDEFFKDIAKYKEIKTDILYNIKSKKDLIDLVKDNNIDLLKLPDEVLDELDELYYNNENFDPKASEIIQEEFKKVYGWCDKTARLRFVF